MELFPLHEPNPIVARGRDLEDVFAIEEPREAQMPEPSEFAVGLDPFHGRSKRHPFRAGRLEEDLEPGADS